MKDKKMQNGNQPGNAALSDELLDNVAGGVLRNHHHPTPPGRPDPIHDSDPTDPPMDPKFL